MGDYLCKGIFGTIKAFYDKIDGIKYNSNINKDNIDIADNSITVNALARKAHDEILNPSKFKKKLKTQRNSKSKILHKNQRMEIEKPQTSVTESHAIFTEDDGNFYNGFKF
jgi:hypothetical protein